MTITNPRRGASDFGQPISTWCSSHSNKIYLEIRNYLKNDEVSLDQVQAYIDQALDLPENPGQGRQCFPTSGAEKKQPLVRRKSLWLGLDSYAQQAKFSSMV